MSSLILPFVVLVVLPIVILFLTNPLNRTWSKDPPQSVIVSFFGLALLFFGLILLVATIRLFSQRGEGTLAPWDPPRHLVVQGVYRYVRNPMHTGVFFVLFGEGFLLRSVPVLVYAAAGVMLHLFYIPFSEERGLEKRFGEPYRVYKRNVPRWIPRLTPWQPEAPGE